MAVRQVYIEPSRIRIARPGYDAATTTTPSQLVFDSSLARGPSIVQTGIFSGTLNNQAANVIRPTGYAGNPGITVSLTDQGFIPITLVNRVSGNQYFCNEFVVGGDPATRRTAWYSAWTYEMARTWLNVYLRQIYDINGNPVSYTRDYSFRYYVFDYPVGGSPPATPTPSGSTTPRFFAGTRPADGVAGAWITRSGFDASLPQENSSYLLSTSNSVGVGQILARGSFSLAANTSTTQYFPYNFAPYVPAGYIAASAGIDAYMLGPTAFLGFNGVLQLPYMTVYSDAVVINNPANFAASGAWFVVRA